MHLPEHINTNHNVRIMQVMDLQAEWSARKHAAAQRVRLGEKHLQALRNEFLEADRNLQEVVDILDSFMPQTSESGILPCHDELCSRHPNALLSASDSSSEDCDLGPVTSGSGD
jgi:hypothetical protein